MDSLIYLNCSLWEVNWKSKIYIVQHRNAQWAQPSWPVSFLSKQRTEKVRIQPWDLGKNSVERTQS